MSYRDFAVVLSAVVVVQYLVLVAFAIKRSRFRDRRVQFQESVAAHARSIEGPTWTVLLLAGLGTGIAAALIQTQAYALFAALLVASLRGALFFLGWWALGWYWRQRATWL